MATRTAGSASSAPIEYRRIVVPVGGDDGSAVELAAELAPEAGASITAVVVVEIPAALPLEAHMHREESAARRALDKARAIADRRGVRLRARIVRARARGEAIVAEADAAGADLIVMQASNGHVQLLGATISYVLRHAKCRVLVTSRRTT
jgi:nucleotide-binding universal stress UspA family protein